MQAVPDGKAAWHAGKSRFKGRDSVNDFSIGIEIVNRGDNKDPYPDAQYGAVADLVAWLMKTYDVPMDRLTGHRDVALPKGRKDDPSDNFDRDRVRKLIRDRLDGKTPGPRPAPGPVAPRPAPQPAQPEPWQPGPPAAQPEPWPQPAAAPPIDLATVPFDRLLSALHDLVERSERSLGRSARPEKDAPLADPGKPGGAGPLLRRGFRGEAVKAMQRRLADLGFDPGPSDGIFGPLTEAAVKAFQSARHIDVDGIVGPQTWNELGIHVDADVQLPDPGSSLEIGQEGEMATVQGKLMTPGTARAFVAMARAASRDGITLRIESAYRSDERQAELWAEALQKYGSPEAARKWVAPPGHSNHRTGKALDIHTTDAIHAWLKAHAPGFGFRQPMSWEPWHWEYEG